VSPGLLTDHQTSWLEATSEQWARRRSVSWDICISQSFQCSSQICNDCWSGLNRCTCDDSANSRRYWGPHLKVSVWPFRRNFASMQKWIYISGFVKTVNVMAPNTFLFMFVCDRIVCTNIWSKWSLKKMLRCQQSTNGGCCSGAPRPLGPFRQRLAPDRASQNLISASFRRMSLCAVVGLDENPTSAATITIFSMSQTYLVYCHKRRK